MFHLRKPNESQLARLHAANRDLAYSYSQPGFTRESAAGGFVVDHNRVLLGTGSDTFERARQGILAWQMLRLGWVQPMFPDAVQQPGELVGTMARAFGTWVTNVCRIVYLIDEPDRYGFAYGTLVGHVEQGEERFLIERGADGQVHFDILAYSRPGRLITRLGYPFVRRFQKRFGRDSKQAMVAWCQHRDV